MTLVRTFTVGGFTCHTLEAGRQRLDGGAMFGVVPKPLWERRIAADERNRIPLAMRCLLVEHPDGLVLIDTGLGNKESDKFIDIYGVENAGTKGPTQLEDAIAEAGHVPGDVKWVINTHLHFDHAGGNTWLERADAAGAPASSASPASPAPSASPRLSFPRATYVVQRGELGFASHTNERTAASYLSHNFAPVTEAGRWSLVEGETDLLPGIRLLPTPGHVPYHQSVLVQDGGDTACFLADIMPTSAHVPLPWIMAYDLEPLVTLETKRRLVSRAEAEGWLMVLEHDPLHGMGRIVPDGKKYAFEPA